jgi:hypothetical protein
MTKEECKDKHCSYNDIKRTRYFHGMLMTERDFSEEQKYHIDKRKLLNRMLHGWGVVCGLKVKPTNPPSPNILVEGGLALDCFGNEILVCEEQTVDLTVKPCATTAADDPCAQYVSEPQEELYVVIRYDERDTKPEAVYTPGGSCEEKTCKFSRTQEGFCIEVWDHPPDAPETGFTTQPCTEPFPCPPSDCCHYILLAKISCKERYDFLSQWIEQDYFVGSKITIKKRIHYQVKRTLKEKVCLDPGGVILVTDIYEFETDEIVNNIKWVINEITYGNEKKSITREYRIIENIDKFEVKVKLEYQDSGGNTITWDELLLPTLISEIDTDNTIVKRGEKISAPMIRNMELRKYVPTFNWFDWIMGEENRIPWSGDLKIHCTPEVPQAMYKAQLDELITRVEELEKNQNGT